MLSHRVSVAREDCAVGARFYVLDSFGGAGGTGMHGCESGKRHKKGCADIVGEIPVSALGNGYAALK